MSEYQYYEFQAVDRPLTEADRAALRDISTRARITATSFTNTYQWGGLKGDPVDFMRRWFDLHLYMANWQSRRLMIRLPRGLVDQRLLEALLLDVEEATLTVDGDNLILDVKREEIDGDEEYWDDGSGRLAALAPLRADILGGDLRVFYLTWLMAVQCEDAEADEAEPMPGLGPLTPALLAFADFFDIDRDLVAAAAERSALPAASDATPAAVLATIGALSDAEKTNLLRRVHDGDPHVASELRAAVRGRLAASPGSIPLVARTVGELRARAIVLGEAREMEAARRRAAEARRAEAEAVAGRQSRLLAIARRGEGVWRDVDSEIARSAGYDKAASLLADLKAVAAERGTMADFDRRLATIRNRHARKRTLIERLAAIG